VLSHFQCIHKAFSYSLYLLTLSLVWLSLSFLLLSKASFHSITYPLFEPWWATISVHRRPWHPSFTNGTSNHWFPRIMWLRLDIWLSNMQSPCLWDFWHLNKWDTESVETSPYPHFTLSHPKHYKRSCNPSQPSVELAGSNSPLVFGRKSVSTYLS